MSSHVVIPVLAAFAVSLVLGPIVIPFLRKLKMKQTERVEGVQSHLKKAGTPTMGGIIILAAVIVTSLFYVKDYPKIIPVLFLTVAFGLIGFLDETFGWTDADAENGSADYCNGCVCILSRESGGYSAYDACAVL